MALHDWENRMRKMMMAMENLNFHACISSGNMLNSASAPLATLMAIVKM